MTRLVAQRGLQGAIQRGLCSRVYVEVEHCSDQVKDHFPHASHVSGQVGVDGAWVEGKALYIAVLWPSLQLFGKLPREKDVGQFALAVRLNWIVAIWLLKVNIIKEYLAPNMMHRTDIQDAAIS